MILEVGIALAPDSDPTNVFAAETWVIHWPSDMLGARKPIDDYVRAMHAANGLWGEVAKSSTVLHEVEAEIALFLQPHTASEKLIMAGYGVGQFDLVWIRKHMPAVGARFSHRVLDTRSIEMFCRDLGMPDGVTVKGGGTHRAIDDVQEAVTNYTRCFNWAQQAREKA